MWRYCRIATEIRLVVARESGPQLALRNSGDRDTHLPQSPTQSPLPNPTALLLCGTSAGPAIARLAFLECGRCGPPGVAGKSDLRASGSSPPVVRRAGRRDTEVTRALRKWVDRVVFMARMDGSIALHPAVSGNRQNALRHPARRCGDGVGVGPQSCRTGRYRPIGKALLTAHVRGCWRCRIYHAEIHRGVASPAGMKCLC
jgi:hypothetical protein